MSIDILKTVAVQETKKFCSEHDIEITMLNMSDYYTSLATPIAHELIATGLSTTDAWGIAYNRVKNK